MFVFLTYFFLPQDKFNIMKKLLPLLICVPFIFSCGGESSTKGKWSSSELEKCNSELKQWIFEGEDESGYNVIDIYGKTADEITNCMCDKLITMYDSWSKSKRLFPNLSIELVSEIMGPCLSTNNSIDSTGF